MPISLYEIMVSWRFLRKGRFQTVLILLGIAAGVAVQFFLLSLIGGLQASIIERVIGISPHVIIEPPDITPRPLTEPETGESAYRTPRYRERDELLSWRRYVEYFRKAAGITAVTPVAEGSGFIETGGASLPVRIQGLEIEEGRKIYDLDENLRTGELNVSGGNVLIGRELADRFNLSTGDSFFLRNNRGQGTFFTVGGTFDLGAEQINNLVLMNLDRARNFLDIQGVSAVILQVRDVFAADRMAERFRREFPDVTIASWQDRNAQLLRALQSQSLSSGIIQVLVVFSISLGIASVLAITAVQKQRQLGILKAMGTTDRSTAVIFILQGMALGFLGSIVGILLGFLFARFFIRLTVTGEAFFELQITAWNIILPSLLATGAASIAALIPARRAARLNPMEVIRNG